jgi:hypothetical protein
MTFFNPIGESWIYKLYKQKHMKTAMQELMEWLDDSIPETIKEKYLEKEKEQIISAYISDRIPCSEQDAEDYYFSTYKIEKITITEHNQNK